MTIYDAPDSMGGEPERWATSARVRHEFKEMCRAIAASVVLLMGLCSFTWSNTAVLAPHGSSDRPRAGHPRSPPLSEERAGARRLGAPQLETTAPYQLLVAGNPVSKPGETAPVETKVAQTSTR